MIERAGSSRRDFLRLGLAAGPAALAAACGWDGGPVLEPRLRAIGRLNDWVGEKIFLSRGRLAREYPVAARTPERLFPAYSITRNRRRTYPVASAGWELEVNGLVGAPQRFTLEMLEGLPKVTYTVKHHCVEGWTAIGTWTGVPVSVLAGLVRPLPEARYLRFDSFDSGYSNGWDLASAMHPQTILAYAFNDRLLTRERGAPLRLYSPIKLGYKMTKYVTTMSFTRERHGGYWEDQGYPWHAGV
ncbi:MAG TPA: molybdopterin-dependent oxidoreductase [Gemmatimonadales bacterium]|jgi:DMSO/TMAO reductase YedYZ molybdopterin-dependent catalytic subunit|nr:molybdopterin-dependent oxidoreductase [Gemmatimonadales bacterium]